MRVLTYINVRLTKLCFSLRKDIINCKDINLISFFNNGSICFLINIYLDDYQSTLKYFNDTEVNLNNILIITGDFNIRVNEWDASFTYYSNYTNFLKKIANSFNLKISTPVNQVSTRYTNNILPDYAFLSVYIIIKEEFIQENKLTIVKNSKEEKEFVNCLKSKVGNINMTNIHNCETLEKTVKKFTSIVKELWYKHARQMHITKYFKA